MFCINCGKEMIAGKPCDCMIKNRPRGATMTQTVTATTYDPNVYVTPEQAAPTNTYVNPDVDVASNFTQAKVDPSVGLPNSQGYEEYMYGQTREEANEQPVFSSSQYVYASFPEQDSKTVKKEKKKRKKKKTGAGAVIGMCFGLVLVFAIIGATVGSNSSSSGYSTEAFTGDDYTFYPDAEYSIGEYVESDRVYTNEWANLSITVPEGYTVNDSNYAYFDTESYSSDDLAFAAVKNTSNFITVYTSDYEYYQNYSTDLISSVARGKIRSTLESHNIKCEDDYRSHDLTIGEETYTYRYTKCITESGESFYVMTAVHRNGTGYNSISIANPTKQGINTILKNITSIE